MGDANLVTFLVSAMATGALVLGLALARRDRVVAITTPNPETERLIVRLVDHIFALHYHVRQKYPDADLPPPPIASAAAAINGSVTPLDVHQVRRYMSELMSYEELCEAAFDLGFDHSYTSKSALLISLLSHLEDRKKTGLLRQWLTRNRPDIIQALE